MTEIRGARPSLVRRARETGDPLPGTRGFAGELDGALVRDVLGREPLFSERSDPAVWSHDPTDLSDPDPVPAGHERAVDGDRQLWDLTDPDPATDERAAVADLRAAVDDALRDVGDGSRRDSAVSTPADGELAIAFSGGVDSATLAARLDAPLYVAGFPDSHDVEAARSAARKLDRELTVVELDHADLERAVPEVAAATGRTNAMDVQIALGLYLAAEGAAADGYDRLAVGQGADELFGGYAKVARAPSDPRVSSDTVRGARREVLAGLPDQLERDVLALRRAGVEPVTPLLDDRVVAAALRLPGSSLVDERGERKVAFRRAVREWVPDEVAFREKKAAQYGSLVARELDRLARQAGFKRRMDDHVTKYVETLADRG